MHIMQTRRTLHTHTHTHTHTTKALLRFFSVLSVCVGIFLGFENALVAKTAEGKSNSLPNESYTMDEQVKPSEAKQRAAFIAKTYVEHIAPDAEYECEQLNDSTTYLCQEQSYKSTTKITFAGFLPEDNKKKLSEKELSEQRIKKIEKQIAPLKGQTFKDCDAVEKQAKTLISKDMKKYFTCKCTDWDDEMNATDGKFSYNCSDGYLQTGVMGTLAKSDKKQSIKESVERVLENGAFHDCGEINKMVKETQKSDMKYLKDCKCSVDGKKFTYECTNPDLILIHITGELTDSEKMSDTEELDEEDSGDEEEGSDEDDNVEEQNKGLKEDVDAIMDAFNKAIKHLNK